MTSSPPPATPGGHVPNEWTVALAVLVGAALVRLAFAALIPLFPDETYYWDWSRHMAASYFDHPWGIAALIHGGDWLASRVGVAASPVTVRLLVIVVGFLASLFGAAIARPPHRRRFVAPALETARNFARPDDEHPPSRLRQEGRRVDLNRPEPARVVAWIQSHNLLKSPPFAVTA